MTVTKLKAQYGTFVSEHNPSNRNFRAHTYLSVSGITGYRTWTVLWFANPFPSSGANVASATLTLRVRANNNTAHAITAQLCGKWSASFYSLNWQTKPAGTGPRTDSTKPGKLTAGQPWDIDLTAQMQQVADGAPFYGILLWGPSSNGDSIIADGYAPYMPTLTVDWSEAPLPPSELSPSGAAVVGTKTPTLTWSFFDRVGVTDVQSVEVQTASSETGFGSPAWDSGVVPATISQMDLSTMAGFPAPAAGVTVWWRVRAQDGSGIWSPWSAPARWSYQPRPTATLLNPDPTASPVQVTDPTPPIDWSAAAGGGGAATRWQVRIQQWGADGLWHLVADSGVTISSESRWTPNVAMKVAGTYQVEVRVWDSLARRRAVPGVPIYGNAFTNFSYTPSATVTAPSGLTVDVSDPTPKVTLTWLRSEQPDEWLILRDGVQLSRHDGDAFLASGSGSKYTMRDALCPNGVHTWSVQAIVNGKASKAVSAVATEAHVGTWLCDEDDRRMVCIVGDTEHDMTMPEDRTQLTPIGSPRRIDVITSQRAYEGSISGQLTTIPRMKVTARDQRPILMDWKTMVGHTFRLLVEDLSIPVQINNVQCSGFPGLAGPQFVGDGGDVLNASFDWHQVGEYPFEVD